MTPTQPIQGHQRSYRYRIYPTRRQVEALNAQLDFACDLWNAALEQRRTAWREYGESVRLREQQHELTELRKGLDLDMNYVAQEMVLQRLNAAFDAFFRRVRQGETPGFPRFKPRRRFGTLAWRNAKGGVAIVNNRLRIQGVGHMKVKWHRKLPSEPKQTRITHKNGRWYVAFAVELEPALLAATGQQVGVDLGVRQFATLSTGEVVRGPRSGQAAAPSIRRASHKAARRQRGSRRRHKAVAELARRKEREANRRLDAAHKAARSLVDRFDLIAVEDLPVRNMVRGNRGLTREINDQGWTQFLACLDDKAERAGRRVIRVNPAYTSQRCHECSTVDKASRRGPRFACTGCGHSDDADVNAARNILKLARTGPSGANAHQTRALPEKPHARHIQGTEAA